MTTILYKRPQLSAQAVWGFDNSKLNDPRQFKKHAILRVFERGTIQDINELFDVYGTKVKEVLLHEKVLSPRMLKTAIAIWPNFVALRQPKSAQLDRTCRSGRLKRRSGFRKTREFVRRSPQL